MSGRSYTVTCLAGHGVGPELMAEATRALTEVARLHGFGVDDVHVPFGGEAFARLGQRLPLSTRAAYLEADAVLVAAAEEPELDEIEAELDLRAAVTRICFPPDGDLTLLSPLSESLAEWTVEKAFAIARERRAHLTSVEPDDRWRELVARVADLHDGVLVEHLAASVGLRAIAFEPERFDVVVTSLHLADALAGAAASADRDARVVARGRLAGNGPGLFAPVHDTPSDLAGHGVADPGPILLAVSLLLGEGLGERAAAATLAHALTGSGYERARALDALAGVAAATTREFTDAVLGLLPSTVTTAEFFERIPR